MDERGSERMSELPEALREALGAPLNYGPNDTQADRALAMAAALRWALTCREFWPEINAAIAALDAEANK